MKALERRGFITRADDRDGASGSASYKLFKDASDRIDTAENEKNKLVNKLSRGDELPTGVLESLSEA